MSRLSSEYTIQEASAKLGVPVQKLRRWDSQGVLVARRTDGGHRRYAREIIDGLAGSTLGAIPINDRYEDELATARKTLREKRRIIQLLLESESRYRDLVETSHDLIWATDSQGRFTYLNTAAHDIFGLQLAQRSLGRCFFDFEAGPHIFPTGVFYLHYAVMARSRTTLPTVSTDGRIAGWVSMRVSRTTRTAKSSASVGPRATSPSSIWRAAIEYLATHDPLTGLANRRAYRRTSTCACARRRRRAAVHRHRPLQVRQRQLRPSLGRPVHRRRRQRAQRSGEALTAGAYRLGGDEFAIHLPDALRSQASDMAESELDAFRHYRFQPSEQQLVPRSPHPSGSRFIRSTVATFRASSNVDIAMYQAKEVGRNRLRAVRSGSDGLRARTTASTGPNGCATCSTRIGCVLFAQPVVRLARLESRALTRSWSRCATRRHRFCPRAFIELAESLGLVQEIDLQVVESC